jgi:hypothetical protein
LNRLSTPKQMMPLQQPQAHLYQAKEHPYLQAQWFEQ